MSAPSNINTINTLIETAKGWFKVIESSDRDLRTVTGLPHKAIVQWEEEINIANNQVMEALVAIAQWSENRQRASREYQILKFMSEAALSDERQSANKIAYTAETEALVAERNMRDFFVGAENAIEIVRGAAVKARCNAAATFVAATPVPLLEPEVNETKVETVQAAVETKVDVVQTAAADVFNFRKWPEPAPTPINSPTITPTITPTIAPDHVIVEVKSEPFPIPEPAPVPSPLPAPNQLWPSPPTNFLRGGPNQLWPGRPVFAPEFTARQQPMIYHNRSSMPADFITQSTEIVSVPGPAPSVDLLTSGPPPAYDLLTFDESDVV